MGEEGNPQARLSGESRRSKRGDVDGVPAQIPDLSDFMTDRFFFGDAVRYPPKPSNKDKNVPDITTPTPTPKPNPNPNAKPPNTSRNSRRTQEWLEEARQIVASSPARRSVDGNAVITNQRVSRSSRYSAPLSFAESPSAFPSLSSALLQGKDRLSTSGRKTLPESRFSGKITNTEPNSLASEQENAGRGFRYQSEMSPTAGVQQWLASILNVPSDRISEDISGSHTTDSRPSRPPRLTQKTSKDRKGNETVTLKDVLKSPKVKDPQIIIANSNGKTENERASVGLLSPPRRSTSGSFQGRHGFASPSITPSLSARSQDVAALNDFLRKQRAMVTSGSSASRNLKFIISAPESTTSSMVAAICYAWLLGNSPAAPPEVETEPVAVPVLNVKRRQMWMNRQAAWLFHYVGIDGRALLFSDEVDIKRLTHPRRNNIVLIGQDEFNTNDNAEVVSPCTLLIDQYYHQAYEFLEANHLRKLLLAGVLLDTKILYEHTKQKDVQAMDLLLIGESPSYKNNFLSLLNQKHTDESFEEVLQLNYGEPLTNGKSQVPVNSSSSSGMNIITQTFSRWFGFGSK